MPMTECDDWKGFAPLRRAVIDGRAHVRLGFGRPTMGADIRLFYLRLDDP